MINRLIQLALIVKTPEELQAYNFHQRTEELFDVYTADEDGNGYSFTIVKQHEKWRVNDESGLPEWIRRSEDELLTAFTGAEMVDFDGPGVYN